jgi:hypothetical protein
MSEHDPGPQIVVQASGRVADNIVSSMKGQPVLLALMLLNVMFLALVWYSMSTQTAARTAAIMALLERCLPK